MFSFNFYVCMRFIVIAIIVLLIYIYINRKPNKLQRYLIACIIKTGSFDVDNNVYFIDNSVQYGGITFHCFIEYSADTKKLTFKEIQNMPTISIVSTITMQYKFGAKKQKIDIVMLGDSKHTVKFSGIIYPATYTGSDRTLHSFKAMKKDSEMKSMCEECVYYMMAHCHFLMMDYDLGFDMLGFKKGIL